MTFACVRFYTFQYFTRTYFPSEIRLFYVLVADEENELFKNSPQSQPSNGNQLLDDFNGHEANFGDYRKEGEGDEDDGGGSAGGDEEQDERDTDVDEELDDTTSCDSFFSGE